MNLQELAAAAEQHAKNAHDASSQGDFPTACHEAALAKEAVKQAQKIVDRDADLRRAKNAAKRAQRAANKLVPWSSS